MNTSTISQQKQKTSNATDEESIYYWSISDELDIPVLPHLYPVEKTHVIITDAAPSMIVSRIAKKMKELSISYTINESKYFVKALTSNLVSFIIRLYTVQDSMGTLVEIQRLSGCAFSFHHTSKSLLQAAKGEIPSVSLSKKRMSRPLLSDPVLKKPTLSKPSLSKPSLTRKPAPRIQSNIQESLEIVESLLKKDRIDANLLGMESLRMLTNPEITGYDSAVTAAKAVLSSEDNNQLLEKIQMLIQHWRLCDDDMEEDCDIFDEKHYAKMHNHALAILSNSLKLSNNNINTNLLSDEFVSSLVLDLELSRPHDSVLAVQCLGFLVKQSEAVRECALKGGVQDALQRTLSFGRCAHDILARESEQACLALKCSI